MDVELLLRRGRCDLSWGTSRSLDLAAESSLGPGARACRLRPPAGGGAGGRIGGRPSDQYSGLPVLLPLCRTIRRMSWGCPVGEDAVAGRETSRRACEYPAGARFRAAKGPPFS